MDIIKETLTWNDIEDFTSTIHFKIKMDNWRPDIIVGLTRGGLLPAKMLSHAMGVEMSALDVSLRDSKLISPVTTWLPELASKDGIKILVVDDINDTGATFAWIKKDWSSTLRISIDEWPSDKIKFAALIHNEPSPVPTDYWAKSINKDKDPIWINFPYEVWHKNR